MQKKRKENTTVLSRTQTHDLRIHMLAELTIGILWRSAVTSKKNINDPTPRGARSVCMSCLFQCLTLARSSSKEFQIRGPIRWLLFEEQPACNWDNMYMRLLEIQVWCLWSVECVIPLIFQLCLRSITLLAKVQMLLQAQTLQTRNGWRDGSRTRTSPFLCVRGSWCLCCDSRVDVFLSRSNNWHAYTCRDEFWVVITQNLVDIDHISKIDLFRQWSTLDHEKRHDRHHFEIMTDDHELTSRRIRFHVAYWRSFTYVGVTSCNFYRAKKWLSSVKSLVYEWLCYQNEMFFRKYFCSHKNWRKSSATWIRLFVVRRWYWYAPEMRVRPPSALEKNGFSRKYIDHRW